MTEIQVHHFLAEKYYSISPYVFCAGNPVNFVDPDGMDIWEIDNNGYIINRIKDDKQDTFQIVEQDSEGNWQRTGQSVSFEYGTFSFKDNTFINSDENLSAELFKFMADNTVVEIGIITTLDSNSFVFTDSDIKSINLYKRFRQIESNGETVTKLIHSHPRNTIPSGYSKESKGDKQVAEKIVYSKNYLVEHYVYGPKDNLLVQYDKDRIIGIFDYRLIFDKR